MIEIRSSMNLAEIFEIAPDSVIILKNAGLDCTGCNIDTNRSLKSVFIDAKTPQDKQLKVLEHLNKQRQVETAVKEPKPSDLKVEIVQEGNKKYYKLAALMFTENAYKNLHQLADKPGLSLHLETGGCSGFKYQFDFAEEPKEKERIYPLSDTLAIYIDDFTFTRSAGSIVDFSIGLHASGLEIINPNSKKACSCGISISF